MIDTPKKASAFVLALYVYQLLVSIVLSFAISLLPVALDNGTLMILSQLICFVIPSGIVLLMNYKRIDEILPLKSPGVINCLMIVAMIMLIQPTMMLVSALSAIIFPNTIATTVDDVLSGRGLIYTVLAVAVVPAVCEEITFRGVIFSGYKKVGILAAALLNGLFFAMVHFSFQQFAYVFILGTIFCYLVRYTGSIWSSILAHFTLNASQTVYSYLYSTNKSTEVVGIIGSAEGDGPTVIISSADSDGPTASLVSGRELMFTYIILAVIVVVSLVLFIILFRAFLKRNRRTAEESVRAAEAHNSQYTYPPAGMPDYYQKQASDEKKLVSWELIGAVVVYLLYMGLVTLAEYLM